MMIMVLLSHFVGMFPVDTFLNRTPIRLLWAGNCAVIGFFFLSGFNYCRSFENKKNVYDITEMVISRYIRLIPVTIISVIFADLIRTLFHAIAYDAQLPISTWGNSFWQTSVLLRDYVSITSANASLWTMSIEIKYVLLIIVILLIDRKLDQLSSSAVGLCALMKLVLLCFLITMAYFQKLIYLPVFYLGILSYKIYGRRKCEHSAYGRIIIVIIGITLLWCGFSFEEGQVERNLLFCVGWFLIMYITKDARCEFKYGHLLSVVGDYSLYIYAAHFPILLLLRLLLIRNDLSCWIVYFICYILFSMLGARCIGGIDKIMTAILKRNFKKIISIVRKENHKGSVA